MTYMYNFSAMETLMRMKIFIDAKINLQTSLQNVLRVVVEVHHALSVVRQIMKLVLKIVHAWRAVRKDVHVRNGTVAIFPFTCFE